MPICVMSLCMWPFICLSELLFRILKNLYLWCSAIPWGKYQYHGGCFSFHLGWHSVGTWMDFSRLGRAMKSSVYWGETVN